jgi:hypothetical protein
VNVNFSGRKITSFPVAVFLSALLTVPILSSCGGGSPQSSVPPIDDTVSGRNVNYPDRTNPPQEARRGLSTGQKVAILAGAAALYYRCI